MATDRGPASSMPGLSDGSIAGDDWRRETRRRARQLVGQRRWNDFERHATVLNCRQLADIVDALLRARAEVRQLTTDIIDDLLPTGPRIVRDLVATCARAYVVEQLGGFRELATGLRIMGVLSCVAQDIDLGRCPCWLAMNHDEGKRANRLLRRSLPELAVG